MKGVVEEIFVAGEGSAAMERVDEVRTVEGCGIEGDRYCAGTGYWTRYGDVCEVTLIEGEDLDYIENELGIGVKNGGCAGMEYTMSYADTRGPHDEVIEDKGVKLLIDPSAVMFLLGTEMDYQSDRMRSGFVFNNPNQTSACGCGESVTLKPADEAAQDVTETSEKVS